MKKVQNSFQLKKEAVKRDWVVVDVKGKVLGRIATQIARVLMGKNKPTYTPHVDSGDYVIVTNAKEVVVTGKKQTDKPYVRHSGYPGGFRQENFAKVMEKNPAKIIEHAVRGMLPKNKLQDLRMRRLKVFANESHSYEGKIKDLKSI